MSTARGLGRVYQPSFLDRKTGERRLSPNYWIQYSFRGVKHREPAQSTKRADAVRLLKRRIADMQKGVVLGRAEERVSIPDLLAFVIADYRNHNRKSLDRLEDAIAHVTRFFGLQRAVDITTKRLDQYVEHRRDVEQAAPSTIRNELAALRRGFTLAVKRGELSQRPLFPTLTVNNARSGFFERDEYEAVMAHLSPDLQPVVTFAYLTGWRKEEILSLQWKSVDLHAQVIRLESGTTKNADGRTLPFGMLPELGDLLRRQWQRTVDVQRETGILVPSVFHREGQPIKSLRGAWQTACELAGVPQRVLHDFRRTAARNLERAGVSRSVSMKLIGHKTESMFRRYAITNEADLSDGLAKLALLHAKEQHAVPTLVPLTKKACS